MSRTIDIVTGCCAAVGCATADCAAALGSTAAGCREMSRANAAEPNHGQTAAHVQVLKKTLRCVRETFK